MARATLAAFAVFAAAFAYAGAAAPGDPELALVGTFSSPTYLTSPSGDGERSARARGRVLSQSPRFGARRVRGARVHLTLSRGRR
jgi:hypothetical protein